MKVALYARCSTKKQDLDSQRAALVTWAKKHKHDYALYEDFAVSGVKESRAGINQLMRDAEAGNFQLVAVLELSRIGRSMGFIHNTIEQLNAWGIPVALTKTGTELNSNSVEGAALLGGLATAAAVEWQLMRERNERARQAIKERNIPVGRKPADVSTAAIVAMREQGYSIRQIAKAFDVGVATIHRRLRSTNGQLQNVPKPTGKSDTINKAKGSVPNLQEGVPNE